MLNYCLVENPLNSETANFIAYVSSSESKNLDDVINFMIAEGSGLTRPQALAYFERLTQTMLHFVGEGHSVNTPLFRIRPSITGVFDDRQDSFDASRHQVKIRISAGLRLRAFSESIQLRKTGNKSQAPVPSTFVDATTGSSNLNATPGGIGVLHGKRLYFDPMDLQQGIFFTPVDTTEKEVRASNYSGVKPAEIHFQLPNLEHGAYLVSVRTKSKNGKEAHVANLSELISV